jgi:hypothetical protein
MAPIVEETVVVAAAPAGSGDKSAVSWGAIIAGALAAAGVSLLLMLLGSGLGLSMLDPFNPSGPGLAAFAVSATAWLIFVQWIASAAGGYITGRLRTRWTGLHSDEVFFRDTSHGFLAWALSTLAVIAFVWSTAAGIVGGGVQATATVASGAAQGATEGAADNLADPAAYFVDTLFRPAAPAAAPAAGTAPASATTQETRAEAGRILVAGMATDTFPAADRAYLAQLVAARTGIPPADAEGRINDAIAGMQMAKARVTQAADDARKAATAFSLAMFLALVVGAFIASVAAALGGKQRDEPDTAAERRAGQPAFQR